MPVSLPNPQFYGNLTIWASHLIEILEKELNKTQGLDQHDVGTARNPAYAANWSGETGVQGAYFHKVGEVVVLGGVVKRTGASAPVALTPDLIFTLPDGYRPSKLTYFGAMGNDVSGPPGNPTTHALQVETDGKVSWLSGDMAVSSPYISQLELHVSFPVARI